MSKQTVAEFIPDPTFKVNPDRVEDLYTWLVGKEDVLDIWFRDNILQHSYELPVNSEPAEPKVDDPMIIFCPVEWKNLPEETKDELRATLPEGGSEPAPDYVVMRVTLNDVLVVDFIKEHASDMAEDDQYTLAILLRHMVGTNAHQVYPQWNLMRRMKELGINLEALGGQSEDAEGTDKPGLTD